MDKYLKRISTALFALLIATGLAFGGSQALSSPASIGDCDSAGEVAECPPHDDDSCAELCEEMFGTTGACNPNGCCLCQI